MATLSRCTSQRKQFLYTIQFHRSVSSLCEKLDNTLVRELQKDPESDHHFPNRTERPVWDGHWVEVKPTPLKQPKLISYSKDMLKRLGVDESLAHTEEFLNVFSGCTNSTCWVTVAGSPIVSPDRYQGHSYGDGRAISIGEVVNNIDRWELQLKGGGRTPFSRGFDGKAVLRSSIREFLVQEAMHNLGIPTTRSISLVVSEEETVTRAWYSDNEPQSESYFPPNCLIKEPCAIATRASSSFLRVGHAELFARRAKTHQNALARLQDLLRYTIWREFPEVPFDTLNISTLLKMLSIFAERQATLATEWIRVGYVQGNMNSDNCLLCGRTMDFGPFGFVEQYDPLWTPFTSDPMRNFGFERQPIASQVQLLTFAQTLLPIIGNNKEDVDSLKKVVEDEFIQIFLRLRNIMRSNKLGVLDWTDNDNQTLWEPLHKILKDFDYTIFFRELSSNYTEALVNIDDSKLLRPLEQACYNPSRLQDEVPRAELLDWIHSWLARTDRSPRTKASMRLHNPKYVPREWMLYLAYRAAESGDYSVVYELQHLFENPYDEQMCMHSKYYCKTPEWARDKPGVSFYS